MNYKLEMRSQLVMYTFDILSLTKEVGNLSLRLLQSILKGLVRHHLVPSAEVCYEAL